MRRARQGRAPTARRDGPGRTPPTRAPGGTRPPFLARAPRRARVALACVPGFVAVAGLVLCAVGIDRTAGDPERPVAARARTAVVGHKAAKPPIVPRERWLGDASYTRPPTRYADRVSAVFVHHTDSPNGYDCADAPRIIQYLYTGQAGVRHWDDIGYNFLVDRCGTIYEGRAGGTDRAVVGAHTQGFNVGTTGIAALGTFTSGVPVPKAMTDAIAAVAAWKLGLTGIDPRATVRLVSTNSLSKYRAGTRGTFTAVSGHTDGYWTACPGAALRARLPEIRQHAARLQGRL
ncbi:peptidoglycan recognition protein [Streptomyces sp. NPDC060006]|uniref:peptidoglycan recognition protein family protein n=1 Tax=unclassified Streptomyces TaxID=2593676 RepID=UPI0036270E73